MADRSVDFLIVGGGVAGGYCARTLREEGAEGSILLVGREPDPPYFRPALSKEYLAGKQGREDGLVVSDDWWKENDVELLTGTSVMKVDAGERVAKLSTREEVGFGKALLATGSNVRRLQVEGCDLEGIHYLRSYGNSDAIRAESDDAESVVLIGGSFIACEVAATLTARGRRCALVMQEEVTFERQFGPEVAGFFQGVLEEHGVEVHGGDQLERFEGADGRVTRVVTKSGMMLGVGEEDMEITASMADLRAVECDILTLGQYLRPSPQHIPVRRYVPPESFAAFKRLGIDMGFRHVEAGPLVRSSYHADEQVPRPAAGSHERIPI